ncbi:Growth differentiation factor 7 [Branchiostoma belcheri]|nr:Growth differentiation factor 7 [Branchiostoma belcheri]
MLAIRVVVLLWGVFVAASGDVGGVHGNQSSGQPQGRLPSLLRHAGQPDPRTDPRTGPRTGPVPTKGPRADPSFMAELFHHLAGADGARKVGPAPYGATTIRFYRSQAIHVVRELASLPQFVYRAAMVTVRCPGFAFICDNVPISRRLGLLQETDVPFHLRHESGGLAVSFNVSSLQDAAVVTSAQLRVFRRARTPSSCRLYVFRASPDGSRRLVSRRRLPAGSAGWEEFDVTQSFSRQQRGDSAPQRDDTELQRDDTVLQRDDTELQRDDTELQRDDSAHQRDDTVLQRDDSAPQRVSTELQQGDSALQRDDTVLQLVLKFKCRHEVRGNRTGPRSDPLPSLVGPRNDTHHPSLVLYLRESEETNSSEPPASRPVTPLPVPRGGPRRHSGPAVRQRRHAVPGKTAGCHHSRAGNYNARPRRPCRRHELYVDFTELGWDWIIAPAGYRAFYCRGECPAIMGQHLRPTNHAVDNGSIVYKEYPDMVAGSCACR